MSVAKSTALALVVVLVALTTQQTRGEVLVVGGRVLYQSDTPDIDYVFTGHPGGFAHNYIGPVFASHPVITPRYIRPGRPLSVPFHPFMGKR